MSFDKQEDDALWWWWWYGKDHTDRVQLYTKYRERFSPRIPLLKGYKDFTPKDVEKIFLLECQFIAEKQIDKMFKDVR